MRVMIADDERPAREELKHILSDLLPEAEVVMAADGDEALAIAREGPFDAVFLDIHMPGRDGRSVARALLASDSPPIVIFATAFDAHAVEAFELAALDYVVKPFDERRLERTIDRLRSALTTRVAAQRARTALARFLETEGKGTEQPSFASEKRTETSGASVRSVAADAERVWAERPNGNRVALALRDVLWFEASDKAVWARVRDGTVEVGRADLSTGPPGTLRVRHTLRELEEMLPARDFARIHRSTIANLGHVAEMVPWFAGGWKLRLREPPGTELDVSRRYAAKLRRREGWG